MAGWIALDEEATQDYLDGYLIPLKVRETAEGIEVFDPHEMQTARFTGTRTCARCGLLPLDYDRIEYPCEPRDLSDE